MELEIEIVNKPDLDLIDFFEKRLEEFNIARWEVKEKIPLVLKVSGDNGEIIAGVSAKTFGLWLLIDNLWVSEKLRGQNLGSRILMKLERLAIDRGCQWSLLDTLNFQARPFYEKLGYKVQWTQNNYPREGCKHFMVKRLLP